MVIYSLKMLTHKDLSYFFLLKCSFKIFIKLYLQWGEWTLKKKFCNDSEIGFQSLDNNLAIRLLLIIYILVL